MKPSTLLRLWCIALGSHRRGVLAGQAFTEYECLRCEKVHAHSNTNTPPLCSDCEKKTRDDYAKEREHKEVTE